MAGSLRTRSTGLAVEAVVEFWHCALDFHLPHLLQGVSGGVALGRHVGRLVFYHDGLWVGKAGSSALWTSFRG